MKKKRIFKSGRMLMLVLAFSFVFSNFAYAGVAQSGNDVKFTTHFIESNRMTAVATGTKKNEGKVLHATVLYIYDSDGNLKDSWKKTKWKIYKGGNEFSEEIKITKGEYSSLTMDEKVTPTDVIEVKAQGNNDDYDARITGYLHYFTKR